MTVKDRAASLDDNLSAGTGGGKAKLMSRMAKMGHAMLPQQPVLPQADQVQPPQQPQGQINPQQVQFSQPVTPTQSPVPTYQMVNYFIDLSVNLYTIILY